MNLAIHDFQEIVSSKKCRRIKWCERSPSPWPSPPGEGKPVGWLRSFDCQLSAAAVSFFVARRASTEFKLQTALRWRRILPLPGGEGRGEGERNTLNPRKFFKKQKNPCPSVSIRGKRFSVHSA